MLYIPKRFAHGFQTLKDETEVFYQMSDLYVPEAARGLRWDDPRLAVRWPKPVTVMSAKDRRYADFHEGLI
jgi:dTDP-4-dehydrorhamnose 3,5-epimerase